MTRHVFITGGTGYLGRSVIPLLLAHGYRITALVRNGSAGKVPADTSAVTADPLQMDGYAQEVDSADTFLHLFGVPHLSTWKATQFRQVDVVSVKVTIQAASEAGIRHFVYVSVAQPAPIMKAYVMVRSACEEMIHASGIPATLLRPWHILGPGHCWPYALLPLYWLCEHHPVTRPAAKRIGLLTLPQMLNALVWAIDNPCRLPLRDDAEKVCYSPVLESRENLNEKKHRECAISLYGQAERTMRFVRPFGVTGYLRRQRSR